MVPKPTREEALEAVRTLITFAGDDPGRAGLLGTPERVLKSYQTIFGGYRMDLGGMLRTFEGEEYDQMIVVRDIEFYSTCEHHLQPFFGKAHIGYIPSGKVYGVSKLARVLEMHSRRLQIQERICQAVAHDLFVGDGAESDRMQGAGCILEAKHFCMVCRGVQKQNSVMVTTALEGCFRDPDVKQEFMAMCR